MADIIPPVSQKQREIKSVQSTFIPSRWLFMDTETVLKETPEGPAHFFSIGWTCLWTRYGIENPGREDWKYFTSEIELNQYIQFAGVWEKDIMLVGHNIFFDLQACGFYDYFTRWGWKLKFYYDRGLTYILKCTKDRASITICSTTNWFDQSLKKLGSTLGLEKLEVDFDHTTPDELKIYCRRDVEIILLAIREYIRFIVTYDLGKFSLTKASQAFTAFRRRFMGHKILIHSHPDVTALERDAYIGGRTEAFFIGEASGGPFVSLDINSMYPYVMRKYTYPWKLIQLYSMLDISRLKELLNTFAVIAFVDVSTPEAAFAVKHKGKTIFPVGDFQCVLCTTGLQYALRRGYLKHIHRAAVYQKADLFSQYVNFFHDLRVKYKNEGNDIMTLLCKYMHNSLYGKFGQLKINSEITDLATGRGYLREDVPNLVTGRTVVITHLMNSKIVQYPEGEGDNSNVAIAAHITENARFELWDIINHIGRSRVLYCDTDSVKIRTEHSGKVKHLIDPDRLGMLKVEDTSKRLWIEGAKNYRTCEYRKIKGIPHKAKEIEPGVFTFDSFVRQVTHLRGGVSHGVLQKTITRRLTASYDKGRVMPSGRVRPFHYPKFPPPA